jgi:uncharacterized membrane protein YphA (DoxX/SURF4 family)
MKSSLLRRGIEAFGWRLFGVMLLWAGFSKVSDLIGFLASIHSFQLPLPSGVAEALAVILPWFELMCGGLLVFGMWPETSRLALFGLLLVFTLVTGQAWVRGLELSCGCFELDFIDPRYLRIIESAGFSFCRNLVLLAACGYLLRRSDDLRASSSEISDQ